MTKRRVKMGEEDDTVNSKMTSTLGGMREVLNKANHPEELIDEFCGYRGQVYPEAEE